MKPIEPPMIAEMLRESLRRGQQPSLTVTSGSMRPLLKPGDTIRLEAATLAQLRVGDLVVLEESDALLTHRLHRIDPHVLMTRGDRELQFDRPFAPERLVGRVTSRRRGNDILALNAGAGRRLNAHLGRLARWENALLERGAPDAPGRLPRLCNHLLHVYAYCLVAFV